MDPLLNSVIVNIVNPLVYLLMSAAIIVFVWGLVQYIYEDAAADKHALGRDKMIYGAIGLAIMVSASGIVKLLLNMVS